MSVKYGSEAKAIVGNKSSGTISNCFYLAGAPTDSNAVQKTDSELKEAAELLSDSFTAAPAGLNDGYPIFSFQIPTYEVSFNINDETAKHIRIQVARRTRSITTKLVFRYSIKMAT